ncbi:Ig-like domain-containing protein [Vibrio cyclitrophicus]
MDMTVLNASGALALGQRIVVSVDGTIKVLEDGQPLQAGDVILESQSENSESPISVKRFSPEDGGEVELDQDIANIFAALEEGQDPTELGEEFATAAGESGSSLVSSGTIERDGEETIPGTEFVTTGFEALGMSRTQSLSLLDAFRSVDQPDSLGTDSETIVDTIAPDAPTLTLDTDSGSAADDFLTNDGSFTVGGTEEGATVEYLVDGNWTTTAPVPTEGDNTITVRQTDAAGNTSGSSELTFTLDTTAPDAPTLTLDTDSGSAADDFLTNDGSFTVGGTEEGATVEYLVDGNWTTTAPVPTEGDNTITVRQTDAAGNTSGSSELTFTLDTTAPDAPTLTLDTDSGSAADDFLTNDGSFTVGGTEEGATAEYLVDGNWTTTAPVPTEGDNTITVRQTDAAGNTSGSSELTFTLDTTAPDAPTLTLDTDSGSAADDFLTNDGSFTVGGTEEGATVEYLVDGNWTTTTPVPTEGDNTITVRQTDAAGNTSGSSELTFTLDTTAPDAPTLTLDTDSGSAADDFLTNDGSFTVGGTEEGATAEYLVDGNWTTTAPVPTEGDNTITVRQTDAAGNTSGSSELTFTLDTTAPDAPTLTLDTDSGSAADDFLTNDGSFTVGGTEEGATVEYLVDGNWTTTTPVPTEGDNTITVRQTDAAGNTSGSSELTFTLDTTAPDAPTLTLDTDSGSAADDFLTNDGSFTVGGTEEGATVEYLVDGNWTTTAPVPTEGDNTITVRQTDAAGNTSGSSELTFTLDTTAPDAPTLTLDTDSGSAADDFLTNDGSFTVGGTEEGATVEYLVDGNWTTTAPVPTEGDNTITVRQTDAAGNTSGSSELTFTLDTTAPDAPTLTLDTDSGSAADDFLTNDGSFTVGGTEEGATVEYLVDGNWTTTAPVPTEGDNTITVRQTDAAGNTSGSSELTFTLDTTAPDAPTLTLDTDSGSAADDFLTNDGSFTVGGTEEGATVEYLVDGNWTTTAPVPTEGDNTITVRQTDAAGNTSGSSELTFTLDTTAASQDDGLNSIVFDDDLVNEDEADSVTLSGQVEVGSTVNSIVISDGNPANDVTVPAAAITVDAETGAVTVTGQDLSGLADGTLTVTMNVTDEAGNTGDVTDETILDTTAASQDDGLNSIVFDDDLVNEDEADSVTLSGQVEVGSTVNSIVISDGNPANDVTVPAAAITVDAETGAVTVTGQDLSGLADGTLTVTMNVTDEAGNTGDVTDETILDTTAASQDDGLNSIVFDDDLVNEDEADSVTLSGQVEVGSTVNSIVISDGNPANDVTVPAAAITVDAETGAVTVTGQDLSGLADGTLTVTMNVTDEAGNTGDVTDETILDTTAASQDDGLNSIVFDDDLVNEDEADSVTLSGQVEVGSTVNSIVISDGNPANDVTVPAAAITVDAETGAVTVTGQDLSGLADGTLTVTMNVTDEAGNTGDVTDETILDTTAASQDDGLNSIVFDDDLVNEDEADSVTLSGQVEVGSTVNSIVISDGNPANDVTVPAAAITVDAETGAVTVTGQDLSGLADGTLTVTMNVTDEAGNTGDVTDETILDTTAASQDDGLNSIVFDDDLVNEDEADSVTLSGQVEVGSTVNSIVISDGNPANDVTVPAAAITVDAETGAVTVTGQDLSGLADGTLTVTMNVTDEAGNTGDVTDETILDTTAASQDDGLNSIVFDDDLVNEDEADSVTLSGQVEVGSTVNSIVISDGNPANDVTVPAAAITVDAETGAVTVTGQDLSGLADGTLTVTMNVTDEAGNTGDVTDETILDTTAASQDDGLNSIVFDDDLVNEDEADSVTLSGQVEVGSTVNSIVISDGNPANDVTVPAAAITVDAETGAVTVTGQDLSGLADGTLTVTMNVTDEAGNTGDVTDETILDTTAASQDDGLNSIVFDDDLVNEDEADSVTLSGQVEVGSTVNSIVISDGNPANDVTVPAAAITVDAETGAVTVTGQDLSGLADGTLTVTMNVTDEAGNTGDVTDETILDTTAASQDDGLNSIVFDDDLVNEDEADSVTLSGQVEVGSTVNSIVISDGNPANDVTVPAAAITVDAETGAVTVTGQDLSGLADGTLTVTMNVTDEAGNTGDVTDETILDTTAASQDDGLNSIVFDDDLVNEDEADSVTLSGQVEVGSTVNSIVISDGNPANDVTVPAAAITVDAETGAVTVTGQDLSGLADGTLTVTMNVTDEAGNTGDVTDETILDTTAASQDDGLNSIVFDDDLVNEDEADSVTLSGQVEVGSTVNSIVISDGNPANDVTVPAAAITVDAETGAVTVTGQDLSGLADGTLTVTMNVTDEAGNTGDVTDETILDTTAASQDDGLNSIVFDDDLVNEDEADSVTLSGQVEVGSTVNSIVISDGNPANDVTVPAAAITVDAETGAVTVTGQDLSGLADGTLTVTMNVTDEAGNTGDVTDETILDTTAASQDDGLNSIVFDDDLVNEDEADSVTLSGQVEVGSTVNSIVISDGNPANDVTVPAAAITVDAETGAVTVTGQDLSGLADGTLTVTMNVTDEAGNTGDVTDETILDTTAASQDDGLNSIVFDDDLVNEDEADSVTLSGQVEVGSTVNSIVISDGNPANDVTVPAAAITVDAETGAVTVTGQDLSGLADGTLTVTMNVTDEAGNTGDVTDETILDTTAASQDDGLNSIVFDDDLVNEDEADSVTLSGQVEVGSTVNSIVISDGNPANDVTVPAAAITVDAETGAVTVTGQDLSGLADGTLTVTMNVTDEAGNTGDVTDETILDTTAASQDDGLNSIVFDDDLVNEDEADSVTLSGQVEVGSTVNSIVISDGNPANDVTVPAAAITVDAETGAVTVTGQDLSGLADGTLTVTMNVTDEAGNTGDVTDETILDTTAASQDDGLNSIVFDDDLVNEDEADSVTLSGQVEVGSTVNSIVISDGNPANDVTVPAAAITVDAETGAVTVTGQDLSGLADGTLTVTMNVTDEAGNTGDVTDETILDTTAASQDDGLNSIVFDDDLVNEDEADSVTLSGQVEVGSTVNSIVISDGNPANDVTVPAAAITVDAETGAVTVTGQDLSGLADGTLTVTMNVTDEAGNTGDVTDETILDTTAASQDDGLNSIVFDDDLVNEDEADSVTLSGQVEVGSTVNSIVISDGNPANDVTVPAAAITVDAETGAVTVTGQDLSGLADGTLTVTMNVTDEAGNTGDVTDETILDTTAASQDDGLNSIVFDDDLVNEDEADSVTLSGQVEVGSTVNSIVISDGNPANDVTVPAAAITVDAETGAVTVTGQDLSGLADGTLTVTMNVTDEAGNTGDVTDETILDTTAASQDDGLNSIVFDDDLVNEDEADSVTLSGQVEVGSTVNSIVISDGNPANDVTVPAAAITVDAETGAVTVTGQDLSGLADGTLTVTMNVTDEAGNTGDVTDETILDTTAASQDDGLNSIVFDDDLVNEDEADSVTLSGQVEVGSTVNSIVISDGNPANDVTVPAAAITVDAETGAVTVTGQDLSGLADGTLTVTMNVTDEAGNTGDVTDETILDTTAASQDDGLNSIVFDDDLVNEDEADSVTLSGQVEVGSTVNSIVISDGNPANDVTVPAAAITVDAETGAVTVTGQDLSGLADGTLTVTMNVTDEAGNTGDVTDETILEIRRRQAKMMA